MMCGSESVDNTLNTKVNNKGTKHHKSCYTHKEVKLATTDHTKNGAHKSKSLSLQIIAIIV